MEHGFRKYTRLLAAFLVLPMIACAQGDFDTAAIDNVFADFNSQTPGCALGIVQSGQLVYGRGYGMANLEHDIPINTTSVFRIGSVSKQFAAAVAALAAMEGYLDLEDQLQKWIPELPDYGEPLTLRHTLNHTSGLRDYITLMSLKGFRGDDFYTVADLIEVQALQEELNFSSGSEYLYSNSGYVLATEAVARAVGKPFKDYAEEVLFRPLQMSHSHFHDDHNHIVPLRADGYSPRGDSFRTNMTTLDMIGDGGVYTSIDDMVHWVTALEQDGIRSGLTPILETRGVLNSGEEISYALGQSHGEHRGLVTIGHGGSWVGFRADVLRFPSQSTSIVTLCNRSDASPSGRAEDRRERAESSEVSDPSPYLGTYYSPELDVNYEFTNTDGSLVVHLGSNAESELQRISGDTLAAGGRTFRFYRERGEVTGFELDAGRVVHLRFSRINGMR